jgi:hypothetical protein
MRETPPPHRSLGQMALACAACGLAYPLQDLAWRCARRHGVLDLTGFTAAVCWAALRAGLAMTPAEPVSGPRVLAPLCGSGLKSKPPA